jgi:NADPH:quinone reductase-like Zn-dependent oxidoreductase
MKSIIFERFGDPADVLEVKEGSVPVPGRGQVLVRMLASPINPSDLLYVRGAYGRRPELPASPGFEGVGVVESAGSGILGKLRRGKRVAVPNGRGGNWQEYVVVPAKQAVPVPDSLPDDQAASFFVNPASALAMVHHILRVPPAAWLLQTAAGSALGRMVIRLGRLHGFRTINVVRRKEQVEELRQLGGDRVICSGDESIEQRVAEITGGQGVRYAIDAVGGATGSAIVRCLGTGAKMLVYGTLADESMTVDQRTLIVGQKRIEGFWLSEWIQAQSILKMIRLFREIGRLISAGTLGTEVGASFPLEKVKEAVKLAAQAGHKGKILLKMNGTNGA